MQARLRYWNFSTNLLTRMFSLEYGYWFGTMLPGPRPPGAADPARRHLQPLPRAELRELIGWDPHNVTEDADLGLRAAVEGYRVGVIDSDTEEEACAELAPLDPPAHALDQGLHADRARALALTAAARAPGRRRSMPLGFLLLIAGTPLTFLLAPVMWVGTAAWYGVRRAAAAAARLRGVLDDRPDQPDRRQRHHDRAQPDRCGARRRAGARPRSRC